MAAGVGQIHSQGTETTKSTTSLFFFFFASICGTTNPNKETTFHPNESLIELQGSGWGRAGQDEKTHSVIPPSLADRSRHCIRKEALKNTLEQTK